MSKNKKQTLSALIGGDAVGASDVVSPAETRNSENKICLSACSLCHLLSQLLYKVPSEIREGEPHLAD